MPCKKRPFQVFPDMGHLQLTAIVTIKSRLKAKHKTAAFLIGSHLHLTLHQPKSFFTQNAFASCAHLLFLAHSTIVRISRQRFCFFLMSPLACAMTAAEMESVKALPYSYTSEQPKLLIIPNGTSALSALQHFIAKALLRELD